METTNRTHWVDDGLINTRKVSQHPAISKSLFNDVEKVKHLHESTNPDDIINLSLETVNFRTPLISEDYQVTSVTNYFTNSQRWIGYVSEINDDGFIAELHDVNDPSTYEMGEFDLKDVPDDDQSLICIGAKFYWSIGYEVKGGTRERAFSLRFQRLVKWTQDDYNKAFDRADNLYDNLNWE